MKVVPANSTVSISYAEADKWNFKGMKCFSGKVYEGDIIKVFEDDQQPIQEVGSQSFN